MSNIFTNYYSKNNITFINYSTGEVSPTLTKALISSFKDFKFKFNYYKIKPHYANYASTKFFIFTKVLNFLSTHHYNSYIYFFTSKLIANSIKNNLSKVED